jgi:hypothetical protein
VLFAAGLIAVLGGISDSASLTHSQLPSAFPATIGRLCVAVSIDVGVALVVVMALSLHRDRKDMDLDEHTVDATTTIAVSPTNRNVVS